MLENEAVATPEELADASVEEVATLDGAAEGAEGAEDTGDAIVEGADITVDEWEALKEKGYDPRQLEKSHTRFTQELEGVKAQAKELEPYKQLKEMMDDDPRIVAALERVLNEPLEGETEVDVLRKELSTLKSGMATERELGDLREWVKSEGLEDFEDSAVIQHAIKNNLGSLKAAYRDMSFDAVQESAKQKALAEVKRAAGASAVHTASGTTKGTPTFTEQQIADMTSAEFAENRPAILAYYDSLKG